MNCRASVAINPGTSPESIEYLLPLVDMVLVMSVNPGYSGQEFLPEVTSKIQKIRALCEQWHVSPDIQVDGGITPKTIGLVHQAGANVFVSGNSIFKNPVGIPEAVNELRQALK